MLFCFGSGHKHDISDDCSGGMFKTHFNTDQGMLFDKFSMVGLHSEAFFIMGKYSFLARFSSTFILAVLQKTDFESGVMDMH